MPSVQTTLYVYIVSWNDIQKEMKGVMLNTFLLVKLIITYLILLRSV